MDKSSIRSSSIDDDAIASWDDAAKWGDHAAEGYLKNESDPQFSASDAAGITASDISSWNTAVNWGDHSAAGYLTAENQTLSLSGTNLSISSGNGVSLTTLQDNLGNHTATQNIQLNHFWLSGDGNDEGLRIDSSGLVGIGTSSPSQALDVNGSMRLTGALFAAKHYRNGGVTCRNSRPIGPRLNTNAVEPTFLALHRSRPCRANFRRRPDSWRLSIEGSLDSYCDGQWPIRWRRRAKLISVPMDDRHGVPSPTKKKQKSEMPGNFSTRKCDSLEFPGGISVYT